MLRDLSPSFALIVKATSSTMRRCLPLARRAVRSAEALCGAPPGRSGRAREDRHSAHAYRRMKMRRSSEDLAPDRRRTPIWERPRTGYTRIAAVVVEGATVTSFVTETTIMLVIDSSSACSGSPILLADLHARSTPCRFLLD